MLLGAGCSDRGRCSSHQAREASIQTSPIRISRTSGARTTARTTSGFWRSRQRTIPTTSSSSGSRFRRLAERRRASLGGSPWSACRPALSHTCRKTTRDVAVRRAYRRCVRNVSACSRYRQQQSADLQALQISPLTDSNRRPPPYHGGFTLRERAERTALIYRFPCYYGISCATRAPSSESPEQPSTSSNLSPEPVPRSGRAQRSGAGPRTSLGLIDEVHREP